MNSFGQKSVWIVIGANRRDFEPQGNTFPRFSNTENIKAVYTSHEEALRNASPIDKVVGPIPFYDSRFTTQNPEILPYFVQPNPYFSRSYSPPRPATKINPFKFGDD